MKRTMSDFSTPAQFLLLGTLLGAAHICHVKDDKDEYTAYFEAFCTAYFESSHDKFTKWLMMLANKAFKNQKPDHQSTILLFVEEHNKVCLSCKLGALNLGPINSN